MMIVNCIYKRDISKTNINQYKFSIQPKHRNLINGKQTASSSPNSHIPHCGYTQDNRVKDSCVCKKKNEQDGNKTKIPKR